MSALPLRLDAVGLESRGRKLVEGVTLEFRPGTFTVVLGPNGAGKSLLLRLAHGLIAPSSGRIAWEGPRAGEGRPHQAMVFQRPVMLRRSALANVAYALRLKGLDRAAAEARARAALDRTGLTALAERPARFLSGGEQQRLALARAWATEPDILFLDEPTANLDPAAAFAVEGIVRAIHAGGAAVVLTTHDLALARRLAQEIVFLMHGRVAERRPAAEFFAGPHSPDAQAFIKGELTW